MLQISPTRAARKPSDHAVRPSPPAVQIFNADIHLIEVVPAGPSCYSASSNGELLITSSRTPFLDAARVLKSRGVADNAWMIGRHVGSDVEAVRGKIGILAKLAVEDDRLGCPKLRRWRGPRGDGAAPPIASRDGSAPSRKEAVI